MISTETNSGLSPEQQSPLNGGDWFAAAGFDMALESLLAHTRPQVQTAINRQSNKESTHRVLDGRAGDVYSEEAFRHFLSVERTRADRSKRNFLLLLISLRRSRNLDGQIPLAASESIFSAIRESVREVDFVGWYRDQKVAAAVLTQGLDIPGTASTRIIGRVTNLLGQRVPTQIGDRIRIRVVALGGKATL